MTDRRLLSAAEAARALGVKPATLYAYVSRGLLRSQRRPGTRGSWFDPGELDRLLSRGRSEAGTREVRIESAVTAIEGGRYSYRGHDPIVLARTHRFEQVAELLWTGTLPASTEWSADADAVATGRAVLRLLPDDALPFDRVRIVAAVLSATDPFRHDLRPDAVVVATRRLLATLVESLPRHRGAAHAEPARFAARLWSRIATRPPHATDLDVLDAALVLLADHELAASTFAVRIAAALRADPYGAIGAGFGVLGGAWHGAVSVAAERLLGEIDQARGVAPAIERRLREGDRLPGFGHPIYPEGDPRAPALLEHVRRLGGDGKRMRQVDALLAATRARGLPPPNVDLGIAALTHVLGFALGTGELLFALARLAGWIAHAIEEYERPSVIRPRAVWVGVRPGDLGR